MPSSTWYLKNNNLHVEDTDSVISKSVKTR